MVTPGNALIGAGALYFLLLVAGTEIGYINGRYAAVVLVAGAATALLFSVVTRKEGVMATEQEETIELQGMGFKGKASGRKLLSENTLWLVILIALAFFAYKHHSESEAQMARIEVQMVRLFEAMSEQTFILSRSQAEREKLDLSMPESLRRKIRNREQ